MVFFSMDKLKSMSNIGKSFTPLTHQNPSISLTASTAVLSTSSISSMAAFLPFVRPVPLEFQRCHWGWVGVEGGRKVEQRRSVGLFGCNWGSAEINRVRKEEKVSGGGLRPGGGGNQITGEVCGCVSHQIILLPKGPACIDGLIAGPSPSSVVSCNWRPLICCLFGI